MMKTNPKVEFYFKKEQRWQQEIAKLRTIVLGSKLTEELKWGVPCYTSEGANIVLIHVFKEYCALLFFKGVLLKDAQGMLVQQTKNVQAGRQMRFVSLQDIVKRTPTIKAYIKEAILIEQSGLQVPLKKTAEFELVEEFQKKLDENSSLEAAFYELTPGRQRGYLLYFSGAKQAKTRAARVETCIPRILKGKGLDD